MTKVTQKVVISSGPDPRFIYILIFNRKSSFYYIYIYRDRIFLLPLYLTTILLPFCYRQIYYLIQRSRFTLLKTLFLPHISLSFPSLLLIQHIAANCSTLDTICFCYFLRSCYFFLIRYTICFFLIRYSICLCLFLN